MAFRGGFIGVIIIYLFSLSNKLIRSTADLIAVSTPPVYYLVGSQTSINNELWGRPTEFYWGLFFQGLAQKCDGVIGPITTPSQLYEAVLRGVIASNVCCLLL